MKLEMNLLSTTAAALVGLSLFAPTVNAAQERVNCGIGHRIQNAVDNTVFGGVINVSGTCAESVLVNKDDVEIVGVGDATVIGPEGSFGTFRVQGRRVVIRGFTIQGELGVKIEQGGSAEIRNNNIVGVTNAGILLDEGSFGNILSNFISGDGSFSGIFIFNGSSANIFDNTVTNPGATGIGVEGNSSAVVGNNTVFDSHAGIGVIESSYIFLPGDQPNTLQNMFFGVVCELASVIRVDEEQIFTNINEPVFQGSGCEIRNFVGVPFP